MDFIVGLCLTARGQDTIMFTIDRLTKVEHCSLTRSSDNTTLVANVFMYDIMRLHGIPQKIISDRDHVYTSIVWTSLQHYLGV